MAMISPADSIPSMIPPTDYPLDGPPGAFRERAARRRESGGITIEARELSFLTGFLAAFSRYINDRHDPEASAEVMRRYRAALRFYDGKGERRRKPKQYRLKSRF